MIIREKLTRVFFYYPGRKIMQELKEVIQNRQDVHQVKTELLAKGIMHKVKYVYREVSFSLLKEIELIELSILK